MEEVRITAEDFDVVAKIDREQETVTFESKVENWKLELSFRLIKAIGGVSLWVR